MGKIVYQINLWCNGSTTVFEAVCIGSNPVRFTICSHHLMVRIAGFQPGNEGSIPSGSTKVD
jgi:hypothetical protein